MSERYLQAQVERDLDRKMVFLGGPRQVGKTTLAKALLRGLISSALPQLAAAARCKALVLHGAAAFGRLADERGQGLRFR